ncbi:MAG: RDD family protein [Planctomycetia bacterium]|nr:RDD family protein [Planctomycetia bacterium]
MENEHDEQSEPLDVVYDVIAPENIAFKYCVAGPFVRSVAYLIDCIGMVLYLFAVAFALTFLEEYAPAFVTYFIDGDVLLFTFIINLVLVFWFWTILFEAFWRGRTPGKFFLGLRTISISGRPITFTQSFVRNTLRYADLMIGPLAIVFMAANDRMARLGDLAAGSVVVQEPRRKRKLRADILKNDKAAHFIAEQIPEDFTVSQSVCDALALYMARRLQFHPALRNRLAEPLATPLRITLGFSDKIEPDLCLRAIYLHTVGTDRRVT